MESRKVKETGVGVGRKEVMKRMAKERVFNGERHRNECEPVVVSNPQQLNATRKGQRALKRTFHPRSTDHHRE